MKKFLVVFERTETGYSAYSPDLPGCVATGKTRTQTEKNMVEAVQFHLEGIAEDNLRIPLSHSFAEVYTFQ